MRLHIIKTTKAAKCSVRLDVTQEYYLMKWNITFDPFKDMIFESSRKARDAKRRTLQGNVEKRESSAPFSHDDYMKILNFWKEDNPDGLQRKFYHIAAIELAWRGGEASNCLIFHFKREKFNDGSFTERLNVLYEKNWTKLVTEQLKKFERSVVESAKNDETLNISGPKWTFGGSFLYTVTLLTTVGYGRMSPKTALGKIIAILYAIIGVPLMLVLLSELGNVLAQGVRRGYSKLCCNKNKENFPCPTVGYHKAATSPMKNYYCKGMEDTASIQLASTHNTPNHVSFQTNCTNHYVDHNEVPKRAILATVRASHTRGRCRQGPVRQILADPNCPTHRHNHGSPLRNSSIIGISTDIELEEVEENDETDLGQCTQHDTPSRIPLIWRPPDKNGVSLPTTEETTSSNTPPVPIFLVVILFFSYIGLGAACFANTGTWTFLDAIYFCFLALSTIGVGDKLPTIHQNDFEGQLHIFACCLYIFVGLVILAMCFSLVQEELTIKCRQLANSLGLGKE